MGGESDVLTIPILRRVFKDTKANLDLLVGLKDEDLGYATDLKQLFRQNGSGPANWEAITSGLIGQGCKVWHSVGATLVTATPTYIIFNTEGWDTDTMWVVGTPTRVTINTAGVYVCTAGAYWDFKADSTFRYLAIAVNRSYHIAAIDHPNNNDGTRHLVQCISGMANLAATDYVELLAMQSSGADLDILYGATFSPALSVQRISN